MQELSGKSLWISPRIGGKVHMNEATPRRGQRGGLLALLALAALLPQTSCVVLPVRVAPGAEGVVVDARTRSPIADAIVVIRFDGRHGDVLPDREVLGHREVRTDAAGRFQVASLVRPGLSAWPVYKTDARVVAVLKEGFLCGQPVSLHSSVPVRIRLEPAGDVEQQRASCSPVPAEPGEADEYMMAWRSLFPETERVGESEKDRQLVRILEARAAMGFGENCRGPVFDLALSRDGKRASYVIAADIPEVRIIEFGDDGPRLTDFRMSDKSWPPRRLAWSSTGDLVLWEASVDGVRSASPSIFGSDRFEVIWRAPDRRLAPPAAQAHRAARVKTSSSLGPSPLEPADLNDEGDSRWAGRSFALKREMNPESGLSADRLRITREDGSLNTVALPGESCGPSGRFGRPHYRIIADGSHGIDLRYVGGGCHAVQIDLETGAWAQLDDSDEARVCSETRIVPASHFNAALRSYAREVERARIEAGADPVASYALLIAPDGATSVATRNHIGEAVSTAVPDFPLATPLRRIEVSLVGNVYRAPNSAAPVPKAKSLEPL
jgi:hypothetical protein